MKYRPDIDGLRAVAVISVILYHLNAKLLPGGFVGVDIFFVISGYLITKLIAKELQKTGSFTFSTFYLRRLRRLFPAMFFVFVFSLVLSFKLFSPHHLIEYSRSLSWSTLSISNIFFWSGSSYFATDSQFKPLLHLWSLSIEEQFYFIWPTLLFLLSRVRRRLFTPLVITILGAASLLLNAYFFSHQQELTALLTRLMGRVFSDVHSTVFYLLPFRVFEFVIGGLLVWLPCRQRSSRPTSELTFVTGMAMIGYSLFAFNEQIPFPSFNGLIPCVGAALVIFSGCDSTHRLSAILSNRPVVFIGLISYSLYLIHWPIIVFYKYWHYDPITTSDRWLILLLSFGLACLMYRFVERPFRKPRGVKQGTGNRRFVFSAIGLSMMILAVSYSAYSSDGWLWRYPEPVTKQLRFKKSDYYDYVWKNFLSLERPFRNNGKPKVILIGDSMAADLSNVIVEGGGLDSIDLISLSVKGNCKGLFPLTNEQYKVLYRNKKDYCRSEHEKVINSPLLEEADAIILASFWWDPPLVPLIDSTVNYLKSRGGPRIFVLGLKSQYPDGIKFLFKHVYDRNNYLIRTPPHDNTLVINSRIKQLKSDFEFFSLLNMFCDESGCQRITDEGYLVIFDGSHLTRHGAQLLGKKLKQTAWFQEIENTPRLH